MDVVLTINELMKPFQ